ncbi:MAG: T9SS type A sorting domain-containing protein [Bacteroidetes bacterium]|nr:T9SS type A sorting domain-containing protein [Bacteroidota bacterium]
MKIKNMIKHMHLKMLCLTVALLGSATIKAQTIQVAVNPDPTYYGAIGQPTWMNNAERTASYGTLYGVIWDDGAGALTVQLQDDASPTPGTATIALAGPGFGTMRHPDMVIGGDFYNYYVMAVYTVDNGLGTTNIYCESYIITGVGTGTLTVNNCGGNHIRNISNTGLAGNAHIDLANDPTGALLTVADRFVVGWEDYTCTQVGGNIGAMARSSSLSAFAGTACGVGATVVSSGCLNNTNSIIGEAGEQVDIAVREDYSGSGYEAFFTYADHAQGNVYEGRWHIPPGSNSVTTGIAIDNPGMNNMDYPRIDVRDNAPNTPPQTQTEIVYRYWDGFHWVIAGSNNLLTHDNINSYFNGPPDHDNTNPVVTYGEGNKGFFIAYANPTMDKVYMNITNQSNGYLAQNLNAPNYDGYEVSYNVGIDGPVAISNAYLNKAGGPYASDNFVCWFNATNGEIDCKTTNIYTPVFKPTETMVMRKGFKAEVYPNPASDHINIRAGAYELQHYMLTDVLGKTVKQGDVNSEKTVVDLKGLPKGLYVLGIVNKDGQKDSRTININ